jgi:hypothetical protein
MSSPKKKSSKKKSPATPKFRLLFDSSLDTSEISALLRSHHSSELVHLELKLVQFSHSPLRCSLPLTSSLLNVVRIIEEHHGKVSGLRFFTAPTSFSALSNHSNSAYPVDSLVQKKPNSELTDWTLPLSSILQTLGLPLTSSSSLTLWYDYKPTFVSPILLKEPNFITNGNNENSPYKEIQRELEEQEKKANEEYH